MTRDDEREGWALVVTGYVVTVGVWSGAGWLVLDAAHVSGFVPVCETWGASVLLLAGAALAWCAGEIRRAIRREKARDRAYLRSLGLGPRVRR